MPHLYTATYLATQPPQPHTVDPVATSFFAARTANGFPYDGADDPAFFCAQYFVQPVTWGVCRSDVRNNLDDGDVVGFFSATVDGAGMKYHFVAMQQVHTRLAVFSVGAQLRYRLFRGFGELISAFPRVANVLVDIPIGLPWSQCPVRPCDTLARRQLGTGRSSSVFPTPCRAASQAMDISEARRLNIAELGRSLSAQTWGICRKVAEVDGLLSDPAVRCRVREIHPEVCFWGLSGGRSMQHSKSTREGVAERMAVLNRHEPRSQILLETVLREQWRKDVQPDDVADALVGFVTAAASGPIQRLQGQPASDQRDLPMEMLYVVSPV